MVLAAARRAQLGALVALGLALAAPAAHADLRVEPSGAGLRVSGDSEVVITHFSFRSAGVWFQSTGRRPDGSYATNDPAGRTIAVSAKRDTDGVVSLTATTPGADAMGLAVAARPGERYLGFGERSNAADQRGHDVENYVAEGPYQPEERPFIAAFVPAAGFHPRDDATYFPIPWLLSTAGYGVLLDNAETSNFHLAGAGEWSADAESATLSARVFGGPRPRDALRRFTAAVGRQPPLGAPWHLGVWFQPSGGTDLGLERVKLMRGADVPVSVAETFVHYLPCGADRNAARQRAAGLHGQGVAALAYFNPMVCTSHPRYGEGTYNTDVTDRPYTYRYSTNSQFLVSQVDFTSPGGRAFYASLLKEAVDDGFDGWMEDFGEYTPTDAGSADGTPGTRMHNLYPLLYHRTAAQATAPGTADYVRSGFTGSAAHSRIVWGGDPTTDWGFDGLASAVTNALTMGTSGVSRWGSDIGGFFALGQRSLSRELLERWIEFGAVSGVMRTEAEGIALPSKSRPQVFDPETLPLWRRYAKLRTQLYPYLLEAEAEYQRTGMPLMRDLALLWPDRHSETEFMVGDDLLAAPVVQPGAVTRRIVLPPGDWIDLWRSATQREPDGALTLTGRHTVRAGQDGVYDASAPRDELPLLVRAGAILPLLPADVDTLAPYDTPDTVSLHERRGRLTLLVFPQGRSTARPFGTERVVSVARKRRWTLRVDGARRRTYAIEAALRDLRPCRATNGRKRVRFRFDAGRGLIRLSVRARRVRLTVRACG